MNKIMINRYFRIGVLVFLLLVFILIAYDVNIHQKYGLSDDPQEHMAITNEIIKVKNLPNYDPLTKLDKADYPYGYHTWLATVVNVSGLNKFAFVFRYSSLLLLSISFLLIFIYVRKIKNENTALLVMIILFFSGGIGWLFHLCILGPQIAGSCLGNFAQSTGLYSSTNFIIRLLYPTTHAAGILMVLMFLYLFNRKRYFLAAITLSTLSYTHRNNFVLTAIFLMPLMMVTEKEDLKALFIPLITLILSFGWGFYPRVYTLLGINLPAFITAENVLRVVLLVSVILFFIFNRKFTKSLFKFALIIIILLVALDGIIHFNQAMPYSLPFYKILLFLYGPLLIGLLLMHKSKYPSEIYCLLITCLFLTQTHPRFTLMDPQRILIVLFIPISIMYATLIDQSKKKIKIILVLLLLLVLTGGFWWFNFYTLERSFNDNIDYYNQSLIFMRNNLPANARVITSPGFDLGVRINIIIPSISERYIYTRYSYKFETRVNETGPAYKEGLLKEYGLSFEAWLNKKMFLYRDDLDSRLLQDGYLFSHLDTNISGTRIEELATHILGAKRTDDCRKLKSSYRLIYEDEKACIFEIKG